MHRIRSAAALAVVLGVATGCGAAGADHQEAGELIATYSEGGHGREWVGQVNLAEAVVLGSAVDVDNWVSTLPGADPAEFVELDQVDLTEHFLVIGGYHQCTETSAIIVITRTTTSASFSRSPRLIPTLCVTGRPTPSMCGPCPSASPAAKSPARFRSPPAPVPARRPRNRRDRRRSVTS
ncbi:hypothetical protein [Sanguibacter sp. Z1732]|uniref:hypothetical protein n=1 Tax=Sanguibacter sp. Z1732 TaxID=3435412 RepID=UPI003D9C8FEC